MIDAEGHDLKVLRKYPFRQLPPVRVIFEASNMKRDDFELAASLLRRNGYRNVAGGHGAALSVWHSANHSGEARLKVKLREGTNNLAPRARRRVTVRRSRDGLRS